MIDRIRSSVRIERWLAACLAAVFLVSMAEPGLAQTIDDVAVLAQGKEGIARITFNANVRFLRLTPSTAADLYRLSFELVAADESVLNQSNDEVKRLPAIGAVPEVTLTYAASPGGRT